MNFLTSAKRVASKLTGYSSEEQGVPAYYIYVGENEAPLKDNFGISSIVISKSINKIPHARLEIIDGDVSKQTFEAGNSNSLKKGTVIKIILGDRDGEYTFVGVIVKQSLHVKPNGTSMLVLELKDKAYLMTVNRVNRLYTNKTDKEIIKEIISDYEGTTYQEARLSKKEAGQNLEARETRHSEMIQYYSTDWDFIVSRAEASGKVVVVNNGALTLVKPEVKTPSAKDKVVNVLTDLASEALGVDFSGLEIKFGENLYEFDAETDARDTFQSIEARSWDASNRELNSVSTSGNSKALIKDYNMQHPGELKREELNSWAESKKNRSNLARVKGRARISGNKYISPADPVKISNFSSEINGYSIISSVNHYVTSTSAYYTDVEFGYTQEWFSRRYTDFNELPASGLLPAVHGLQPGIVVSISGDPESNYRIKVKMPLVVNGEEGVWARLAALDAGADRGSFFMPEVGDEVVLGFMNDDPRQPVILGMMFSQNNKGKPPLEPEAENNLKGFYTRSKIKLEFDDKRKGLIIKTPKGCEVVVSDEGDNDGDAVITLSDTNKNKITMDKKGISISTEGELTFSAKKNISLKSQKDLSHEASGTTTVKGDSGTTIRSGANVEIKGTLVKIN